MRRASFLSTALALALLAQGCSGCKDKAPSPQAKTETTGGPERDRPGPARAADPDRVRPRPPPRIERPVRRNAPLTVADATAAVTGLAGTDLVPPAMAPSGMQVRFSRCVAAGSIDEAGAAFRTSLEGAGWAKLAVRPPEGAQTVARYGIAAEKADLRLSVTIRAVRRTGCDETVGQYFAVATMNRIAPPGAPPLPGTAPSDPPPENE